MHTRIHSVLFISGVLVLLTMGLSPNATAQQFSVWMNETWNQSTTDSMAASTAALGRRASSNQVESSSATGNSTSLLDRSSATDFLGLALNLADLSGESEDGTRTNSGSVTTSAYAFKTLLTGDDPLDPKEYCDSARWRQGTLTLGFEGDEDNPMSNNNAVTIGAKYVFWNGRDPCSSRYDDDFKGLTDKLALAAKDFGAVVSDETRMIFKSLKGRDFDPSNAEDINFLNEISNAPDFEMWMKSQTGGAEVLEALRKRVQMLGESSKALQGLREASRELFQKIHGAPQSSIQFMTQQQSEGPDEYELKLLFDCGSGCNLSKRLNFTANGGFKYVEDPSGSDDWSGNAAFSLQIHLNPTINLLKGRRFELAFSGKGDWHQDRESIYEAQAKFSLPLFEGFEVPISFNYATRTEMNDEEEFRFQAGITVDTSRLLSAGADLGLLGRLVGGQ